MTKKDIKVGQFVRDNEFGKIGKITEIKGDLFEFENGIGYFSMNDYKFSKNIIDLIEVGDIVEVEDMGDNRIIHINDDRYLGDFKGYVANEYFEVKSLLTHEQFESMKYVVGDK